MLLLLLQLLRMSAMRLSLRDVAMAVTHLRRQWKLLSCRSIFAGCHGLTLRDPRGFL